MGKVLITLKFSLDENVTPEKINNIFSDLKPNIYAMARTASCVCQQITIQLGEPFCATYQKVCITSEVGTPAKEILKNEKK